MLPFLSCRDAHDAANFLAFISTAFKWQTVQFYEWTLPVLWLHMLLVGLSHLSTWAGIQALEMKALLAHQSKKLADPYLNKEGGCSNQTQVEFFTRNCCQYICIFVKSTWGINISLCPPPPPRVSAICEYEWNDYYKNIMIKD